ncbi:MAG: nuclear transport factor 2 family protein [Chromatiales bacterium]|jgi:steroid delta-isomerase-like uncharacterized protein|nr:nuclear transport factor 2 family protein [Chromatiales bacterium]
MSDTVTLIRHYYEAFNAGDSARMLSYLSADVVHDVNQGERRIGKDKFREFNERMSRHYQEMLTEIVIMVAADGTRAAAEFTVNGSYIHTDADLPPATGQRYVLPAGAFFAISDGRITRVTTYYNLADWISQVTA